MTRHTYSGPQVVPITAGALVRRQMRRYLLALDAPFTEERGLLDSVFYLRVPAGQTLTLTWPPA